MTLSNFLFFSPDMLSISGIYSTILHTSVKCTAVSEHSLNLFAKSNSEKDFGKSSKTHQNTVYANRLLQEWPFGVQSNATTSDSFKVLQCTLPSGRIYLPEARTDLYCILAIEKQIFWAFWNHNSICHFIIHYQKDLTFSYNYYHFKSFYQFIF